MAKNTQMAYRIPLFCKTFDLSRSAVYEAMRTGQLQYCMVSGRRLILREHAEAFLQRCKSAS